MRRRQFIAVVRTLLAIAVIAALTSASPASGSSPDGPDRSGRDWEVTVVTTPELHDGVTQGVLDADPHGLVPKAPFVQRYSLDTDHFEVWLCGSVSHSMSQVIAQLEATSVGYFDVLSGGRYTPMFSAGGSIPGDASCISEFLDGTYTPVGSPEVLLVIDSVTGGGFATPGPVCSGSSPDCPFIPSTFPDNGRYAIVGESALFNYPAVAVHEIGHTLQWPHSFSGITSYEYDNPIDVMSGNYSNLGTPSYTEPDPYATLSYNRYQSGWLTAADVIVANGTYQAMTLEPFDVPGTQLFAVKTAADGRFYALGTRKASSYDPIAVSWEGVEVYFVDHNCGHPAFGSICPGLFREHHQEPPNEYDLLHVLQPGDSIVLEGLTITVTGATATGYTLTADPGTGPGDPPSAPGTPSARAGNTELTASWLAAASPGSAVDDYELELNNVSAETSSTVRVGPNLGHVFTSLTNDQYYRVRARAHNAAGWGPWSQWSAEVMPNSNPDTFIDDDGSIFEDDIEWLAATDITRGCNPPVNDRFCPGASVTRGQMAAFLARALDLPIAAGDWFVDDDGSMFEGDIERLAAAGITVGCNPPDSDRFCPQTSVTRGQMAAFLVRALDLPPVAGDWFVDDDGSMFEGDIERLAAAGITVGCNPPDNDRFCPDEPVSRGQMAAFMRRALES